MDSTGDGMYKSSGGARAVHGICQVVTASISFVASATVAVMIVRSKTITTGFEGDARVRIRTPALKSSAYHRIIFGLSIADVIFSFALLTGPFVAPSSVPQAYWAAGNDMTCKGNAVMVTAGLVGIYLYMWFLCYFCWFKINNRGKITVEISFIQKIEWKLHLFIVALSIFLCVVGFATNTFHSSVYGTFCSYSAVPTGCRQNPERFGECDQSIATRAMVLNFFLALIFCLSGIGIIGSAVKICVHMKKTSTTTAIMTKGSDGPVDREPYTIGSLHCQPRLSSSPEESEVAAFDADGESLDNAELDETRLRRAIVVQANLYVLAFLATIIFGFISQVSTMISEIDTSEQDIFVLLGSIFGPLGGLYNILVYTRPKILILRRNNPDMSWIRAFILVVKAGGIVPLAYAKQDRNLGLIQPDRSVAFGVHHIELVSSNNLRGDINSTDMAAADFTNIFSLEVTTGNILKSDDIESEAKDEVSS